MKTFLPLSLVCAFFFLLPRLYPANAATVTLDYNDITVDGSVSFGDPTYTRWVVGNFHQLGDEMGTDKHRAFIDFNTTDVPDGATINSVALNISVQYAFYSGEYTLIKQMDHTSAFWANDAGGNSTFWTYMGSEATIYVNNYDGFSSTGMHTIPLGATAASDFQNQLAANWFSISLLSTDENSYDSCQIQSMAAVDPAKRPTLTIDYTVDTTPPAVVLDVVTSPSTDVTPIVTGTATDADGTVEGVEFQVNGTSGSWTACTADDSAFDEAAEDFTCDLGTVDDGTYTIYVRATDNTSHVTAEGDEENEEFIVDTTGPTFQSLPGQSFTINLENDQVVSTNPFLIQVKPTDISSSVDHVEFYVDDELLCTDNTADGDGVYECSWDTSLYHSDIRVVAYDGLQNETELARDVTVDLDAGLSDTGQAVIFLSIGAMIALVVMCTGILRKKEK